MCPVISSPPERMRVYKDLEAITEERTSENPRIAIRSRVQNEAIFLELFSGSGNLSKALRRLRLDSSEVEILKDNRFDLSRRPVQLSVLRFIREGRVWGVHCGTPCTIWSQARTVVSNNKKNRKKERLGRLFAAFTREVCEL